mmetsp:Transcript_13046/g.26242  ORF Transcript_13046/g.26242 Transcript_13046/m.26242 type:complete len:229 (+) Transcript_13046:883-1569(+)
MDVLALAEVDLRWRFEAHEGGGASGAADAAELKLRGALHAHDLVLLEEVQRQLANLLPADNHVATRVRDGLDDLLERILLRVVVRLELLCALEEHGALGLSGSGVERDAIHGHLGIVHLRDLCDDSPRHAHAPNHRCLEDRVARDLCHTHVVGVEIKRIRGHREDARLGDLGGEEVLIAILLRRDDVLEALGQLRHVLEDIRLALEASELVECLQSLLRCSGVARNDF